MIFVIFSLGTGILAGIAAIVSARWEAKHLLYTMIAIIVFEIILFATAGAQGGEVKKYSDEIVICFALPTCIGGTIAMIRMLFQNRYR